MAKLAIQGHATLGREVIELLEILGGINKYEYSGINEKLYYFISNEVIEITSKFCDGDVCRFTLDGFLEKFPYKVRDKVICKNYVGAREICEMKWDGDCVKYGIGVGEWFTVSSLQPYKEETIQLLPVLDKDTNKIFYYTDEKNGIKYAPMEETTLHLVDGYVFIDENGNVIDAKKVTLTKKKPQYPSTYDECCVILDIHPRPYLTYTWNIEEDCERVLTKYHEDIASKLDDLRKLLICRDAYWKIAGDWEPDFHQTHQHRYYISSIPSFLEELLPFPTEEMRNAFYENFKDLIEQCKELL